MIYTYTLGLLGVLLMLPLSLLSITDPWVDADGDGVPAHLDCDDNDPEVYYWQEFYLDEDHDGYGTGEIMEWFCWGDEWYHQYSRDERSFNNLDCDDLNGFINPGMPELCDGLDNDCNPDTPDGFDEPWFGQTSYCGEGESASTNIYTCIDGVKVDTCMPLVTRKEYSFAQMW